MVELGDALGGVVMWDIDFNLFYMNSDTIVS